MAFLIFLKSFIIFAGFCACLASKSNLHKRNAETSVESVLEAEIKTFPVGAYIADVQLFQQIDKVNSLSQYRLLTDESYSYSRNQDDSVKEVVVLTKEEDRIPFRKNKRAFVVFRKAEGAIYFAKLALLRDAGPQDKNPVSINGTNRVVEWTVYDDHLIPGRSPLTLTALTCVSSILVPCLFNGSVLTPPERFVPAAKFAPKQSPEALIEEAESAKFQTADGSDPDDNYDYYADLEVNKVQGRLLISVLSGVGGVVPEVLGSVTGLLCSVLNILSICPGLGGMTGLLGGRRKREADFDKVMEYPGWKTQYVTPSKDITFLHENEIFFGFGNCPFVQVKPVDLTTATNEDEIIWHYVTVLRANCIPSTIIIIEGLIKDGLVSISKSNKAFELTPNHKYLTTPGQSLKELLNLNTAVELAAFSSQYIKEAGSSPSAKSKVTAPGGQRLVSRSTHFIVQVGLTYLKITRELARSHILHLTRNLVLNVLSMFTKLAQDSQNLHSCADCSKDAEVNFNDRLLVMSLSRFIKNGLGPVERGADVFETFDTFYKQNEAAIVKIVNVYS